MPNMDKRPLLFHSMLLIWTVKTSRLSRNATRRSLAKVTLKVRIRNSKNGSKIQDLKPSNILREISDALVCVPQVFSSLLNHTESSQRRSVLMQSRTNSKSQSRLQATSQSSLLSSLSTAFSYFLASLSKLRCCSNTI